MERSIRGTLGVLGATAGIGLAVGTGVGWSQSSPDSGPEDLVFFTEDLVPWIRAGTPGPPEVPGCDAISVFSLGSSDAVCRGWGYPSPGRLAGAPDMSLVLASQTSGDPPLAYALKWEGEPYFRWASAWIQLDDLATLGGIAVLPSGDIFLAATCRHPQSDSGAVVTKNAAPCFVRKYRVPQLAPAPGVSRLGLPLGSVELDGVVVEILLNDDGRRAHLLTDTNRIYTIDTETMAKVAGPLELPPYVGSPGNFHKTPVIYLQAALSCDGRYVVGNRGELPQLRVADLVEQRAWTLDVAPDVQRTGGVALNCGWVNRGLLALHAVDEILIYRFAPNGPLELISRTPIRPARVRGMAQDTSGPLLSIAWSGSGSHVIAATDSGRSEFISFRVTDGGATLAEPVYMAACDRAGANFPNDILTANGMIVPPVTASPTSSPTATRTITPSMTPTARPTATCTAQPSETATPSPTATPRPGPIYLPLSLREQCIPGQQRVDVALVIDASSSMEDPTSTGRRKLDAALEAVSLFLGNLVLPSDQAAIVVFNSDAWLRQELTGDRGLLASALQGIQTARQTRLDRGVAVGHEELVGSRRRPGNQAVMIVLTDGLANPVPASGAVEEAAAAKADQVTIFTIGLGNELDEWALQAMASRPDYYYWAPDAEELADIYRRIAVTIPCPAERFWGRR